MEALGQGHVIQVFKLFKCHVPPILNRPGVYSLLSFLLTCFAELVLRLNFDELALFFVDDEVLVEYVLAQNLILVSLVLTIVIHPCKVLLQKLDSILQRLITLINVRKLLFQLVVLVL